MDRAVTHDRFGLCCFCLTVRTWVLPCSLAPPPTSQDLDNLPPYGVPRLLLVVAWSLCECCTVCTSQARPGKVLPLLPPYTSTSKLPRAGLQLNLRSALALAFDLARESHPMMPELLPPSRGHPSGQYPGTIPIHILKRDSPGSQSQFCRVAQHVEPSSLPQTTRSHTLQFQVHPTPIPSSLFTASCISSAFMKIIFNAQYSFDYSFCCQSLHCTPDSNIAVANSPASSAKFLCCGLPRIHHHPRPGRQELSIAPVVTLVKPAGFHRCPLDINPEGDRCFRPKSIY